MEHTARDFASRGKISCLGHCVPRRRVAAKHRHARHPFQWMHTVHTFSGNTIVWLRGEEMALTIKSPEFTILRPNRRFAGTIPTLRSNGRYDPALFRKRTRKLRHLLGGWLHRTRNLSYCAQAVNA